MPRKPILTLLHPCRLMTSAKAGDHSPLGEVKEKLAALGLTLVCVLLCAAGVFYELERNAGKWEGLRFHQAIYWASITISTVGGRPGGPLWQLCWPDAATLAPHWACMWRAWLDSSAACMPAGWRCHEQPCAMHVHSSRTRRWQPPAGAAVWQQQCALMATP
jgi:hypothetical protein